MDSDGVAAPPPAPEAAKGPAVPAAGEGKPPESGTAGTNWRLIVGALALSAALGIVLGIKVGRALGTATLVEPPPIDRLRVQPCPDCAKRKAEAAAAATSPAAVEAMVKAQQEVEASATGD